MAHLQLESYPNLSLKSGTSSTGIRTSFLMERVAHHQLVYPITKGFTEIIHIKDENEEFYLNSFSISPQDKMQVEEFIKEYIIINGFADIISVL